MRTAIVLILACLCLPAMAQDADPYGYTERMEILSRMHSELPGIARDTCDRHQRSTQWPEVGTLCEIDGSEAVCMPYLPLNGPLGSCANDKSCQTQGDKDCRAHRGSNCGAKKGTGKVVTLADGTGSCSFECCDGSIGIRRCYRPTLIDLLERQRTRGVIDEPDAIPQIEYEHCDPGEAVWGNCVESITDDPEPVEGE